MIVSYSVTRDGSQSFTETCRFVFAKKSVVGRMNVRLSKPPMGCPKTSLDSSLWRWWILTLVLRFGQQHRGEIAKSAIFAVLGGGIFSEMFILLDASVNTFLTGGLIPYSYLSNLQEFQKFQHLKNTTQLYLFMHEFVSVHPRKEKHVP